MLGLPGLTHANTPFIITLCDQDCHLNYMDSKVLLKFHPSYWTTSAIVDVGAKRVSPCECMDILMSTC